jgi:hypothetical protein
VAGVDGVKRRSLQGAELATPAARPEGDPTSLEVEEPIAVSGKIFYRRCTQINTDGG